MSEVVIPGELNLNRLKGVLCRTIHEARMLIYMLGQKGLSYDGVRVEQRGSVFFKKAIFIVDMYTESGFFYLRFHAPVSYSKSKYCVGVEVNDPYHGPKAGKWELEAGRLWSFAQMPAAPNAVWKVTIEDCVAFEGYIPAKTGLIF